MKERTLHIWITALFCLAVFTAPALFFLLPKEDFSEREKRFLAPAPAFSAERLADGGYTEKLDDYVTDHFPGRELLVGINAYYDLLSGRQAGKEYFLRDGRLFARPEETDDLRTLEMNLELVNGFCRELEAAGADVPVTLMLVPSSGAVLLEERDYPDAELIAYANGRVSAGSVDLTEAFRAAADPESLYYRTDHHWTSEGAFEAACAYRRALGRECLSREDYTRQTFGPFYGSAYSASGLWLTRPDSLELWYSGSVLQVTNETGAAHDGVFYPERLAEQDKYTVFLDGNHAVVRIENLSGGLDAGRSLLVIRDSYSNSMGCFLADLYDKVVMVDYRYYKLPLTELLLSEGIDEILIEYSVDNFLSDTNLAFLSVDARALRPAEETPEPEPEPEPEPAENYFAPPAALDDSFFDGAYFLGDSVLGTLASYCLRNDRLAGATLAANARLSYFQTVNRIKDHLAHNGRLTTLPALLRDARPRMLVSALGCNDLANYRLEVCEKMVVRFLEMVRETDPDITIFLQSVMPVQAYTGSFSQNKVDQFNAWLRDNAEVYGYCYIELDGYFKDADGLLSREYMEDDTHINASGAPVWVEQLLNIDNYHNFPEQYCVEYDGATGLPAEEAAPREAEPEIPAAPPREETLLDEIYARICAGTAVPEMLELSERTVGVYLGLQPGSFRDGRFYLCANNLHADEIWLVETESEDAARAMLQEAQARIEVKASSYDQYLPAESELARRGVAVTAGRYAALFISPDAEAMRDIFLEALGQAAAP